MVLVTGDAGIGKTRLGHAQGGSGKLLDGGVCSCVPLVGLLGGRARSDPERCERLELVEVAAP